jgi:transcriptional regulator with XRE-family HTH domain
VSNPYLSQVERGLRMPSARILQQIARGLRISAEVLYVQAGILDPRVEEPVVDAVVADPHLSDWQKQALLDIYQSFRRVRSMPVQSTEAGAMVEDTGPDAPVTVINSDLSAPDRSGPDPSTPDLSGPIQQDPKSSGHSRGRSENHARTAHNRGRAPGP